MIAGTQHGGRPGTDPSPGPCVNPRNPHSATPALRALFVALEEWVRTGTAPPSSCVPSIAQGTAVAAEAVKMPTVPGAALPPGANRIGPPVDWVEPPARLDNFYGTRVCAVDADGNEVAGVRLPSVVVPLGTYTGWNVYRAQPCELCDRGGSLIPFARTSTEREAAGDPPRRSKNTMAAVTTMSLGSKPRPPPLSLSACYYRPTPPPMLDLRRNALGSD
jgi:hypothetical protein